MDTNTAKLKLMPIGAMGWMDSIWLCDRVSVFFVISFTFCLCEWNLFDWLILFTYNLWSLKSQDLRGCLDLKNQLSICLSMYLCIYLCIYLSVCLSVCLSVYLPACLPAYLHACLSVCLPACLPACLSVSIPTYQPACLPACLSVCLSVCLSIYLLV